MARDVLNKFFMFRSTLALVAPYSFIFMASSLAVTAACSASNGSEETSTSDVKVEKPPSSSPVHYGYELATKEEINTIIEHHRSIDIPDQSKAATGKAKYDEICNKIDDNYRIKYLIKDTAGRDAIQDHVSTKCRQLVNTESQWDGEVDSQRKLTACTGDPQCGIVVDVRKSFALVCTSTSKVLREVCGSLGNRIYLINQELNLPVVEKYKSLVIN